MLLKTGFYFNLVVGILPLLKLCDTLSIKALVLAPANISFPYALETIRPAAEIALETAHARGVLSKNVRIDFEYLDTKCDPVGGYLEFLKLVLNRRSQTGENGKCDPANSPFDVLFGPTCSYVLSNLARYNHYLWRLPIVSIGAFDYAFHFKSHPNHESSKFMPLTGAGYSYIHATQALFEIAKTYQFDKMTMVYDQSDFPHYYDSRHCVLVHKAIQTFAGFLKMRGQKFTFESDMVGLNTRRYNISAEAINSFKKRKQIALVVLCADADSVREIMIKANDLNFINGEYVFFNIDLFSSSEALKKPWFRPNDSDVNNQKALNAYRALMTITLKKPDTDEYRNFSAEVKKIAQEKGYTYNKDEDVNSFVGAFHDAVLLYALALNDTLADGISLNNGSQITKRMWNRTFQGITGLVSIDQNGDRNADYTLLDLDTKTQVFRPVGHYNGMTMKYEEVPNEKIDWVTKDNKPPSDTPRCGYDNSGCPGILTSWAIFFIAMSVVAVIAAIMGYFFYRRAKMQAELNAMNWIICWNDIETHEKRRKRSSNGGSKKSSSLYRGIFNRSISRESQNQVDQRPLLDRVIIANDHGMAMRSINNKNTNEVNCHNKDDQVSIHSQISLDTLAGIQLSNLSNNQMFARTGVYKGTVVALKKINRSVDINREILMEVKKVKDLNNNHVARLIGICLDSPNECIITEYCQKGSLQDVLENEQINLDWMFKFSLIQDICRGMIYLHNNIGPHGNLKSSNCLVDSRFVLKITDFGLPHFRLHSPNQKLETYQLFRNKLWTAPELLCCTNNQAIDRRLGTVKGDVYSFAIVCQEIIYRNGVFYLEGITMDPTDIIKRIVSNEKPPFRPTLDTDTGCPQEVINIVRGCWDEDPNHRPDFHRIKIMMRKLNSAGDSGEILDNLLSRMEQYANNLEGLVAQRTEQYYEEKKKAEDLLYSMLPKSVAGQLIRGEPVTAESYDSVTVYFSDICGFTSLSAQSTAMQVISLLNDLYTLFDSIIENYDAYKVETIGDAYMVVSGLPQRNGNLHAREVARMSLAFLESIRKFKIAHKPDSQLKLRIGINSGPVCAGVVGRKMPRYCLFGDTVNTASRMESSGEALKIHVSQSTKDVLDTFGAFITVERGLVELKGKGKVKTYWLLGENAETQFL